jgi:nucleoside-diphosphate-sugar epimerase
MSPAAGGKVPCLVTGGAGFLGKNLVQQLVQSGAYDVTIFDIRDAQINRVKTIVGDLRDLEQVAAAVKGSLKFQGFVRLGGPGSTPTAVHLLCMSSNSPLLRDSFPAAEAVCGRMGVRALLYSSLSMGVFMYVEACFSGRRKMPISLCRCCWVQCGG